MAEIKSASRSAEKWRRQSQASQPEYVAGVQETKKDWEQNTQAASENYEQAIQAAISDKRFQSGVAKAGTQKWRENTLLKGPARWTDGIAKSGDAYTRGFAPFRQAIEAIDLPPRGPKGSPQNLLRVAAIANKLHETKLALNR